MTTLKLHPVGVEDCSALADIWFAAFSDPASRALFPDTPGVRQWLESAISYDLLQRPFQRYVKIVDSDTTTNNGHRVAAYAKWDISTAEERGPRYPAWHADMPAEQCEAFVMRGDSNRKRVMGEQKHICIYTTQLMLNFYHANYYQSLTLFSHIPIINGGELRRCFSNGDVS